MSESPLKKGKQTWWGSIVEAKTNILIGCVVAYVSNLVILPAHGLSGLTAANNLSIVFWFTVVSVVRQLIVRRFFNRMKWGHHK